MNDYLANLQVKIFADGADKRRMLELAENPLIQGFTTNPTLMRQAGVTDYEGFARDVIAALPQLPISFEVFSDDLDEMYDQARVIASWGNNVYVKIPVTNTRGECAAELAGRLSDEGVKVNVTALLTVAQVEKVVAALEGGAPSYISVFAGRIADAGHDPVPTMKKAVELMRPHRQMELIWASPREIFNIIQASTIGCHVITVTPDLLKKISNIGRDLDEYSLDTVRMFYRDATEAGFRLNLPEIARPAYATSSVR